ncbi:MAG: sigma-54-dependent Fis family transcriptional regulator [Burkholderiales bacterium]|nr:sigma-54-dependent Fis family transcriptional regulator [Burkholderiales bacterium]
MIIGGPQSGRNWPTDPSPGVTTLDHFVIAGTSREGDKSMRKLATAAGAAANAIDGIRAQIHFCADTGQIWLHENRMLLVHAEAQALLRKELIDSLGLQRARGLLTRMGYASGVRDAELARRYAGSSDDLEAFMTGPRLHSLEGIVQVTPIRLELDRAAGRFYGEFLWQNSWEGQWHRQLFGIHHEPVCWTQIGYASGYTSAFMGQRILYKEVECAGAGDPNCRIIGRPVGEWDDADEMLRDYNPESIADQLLELQTQVTQLRSSIGASEVLPAHMIGNSPGFRQAYGLLRQAADSRIPVLLLGETGVGKEVFARCLHEMGPRRQEPFVAVNCAAIPPELLESELFGVEKGAYTGAHSSRPGRFERAGGGTLFLDEIGDLPLPAQAKLLRVLQEHEIERLGDSRPRKVNVRVVAATNADLSRRVQDGRFRLDLYYRLNAYQVPIPPLRERKEDISPLSKAFLEVAAARHGKRLRGFTDKAKRALLSYPWPGNVRELQNVIERCVILAPSGTRVEASQLFLPGAPTDGELAIDADGSLRDPRWAPGAELCEQVLNGTCTLDELEAMLLQAAVAKAKGNLASAARLLGITRPQLAYRLKCIRRQREADAGAAPAPRLPAAASAWAAAAGASAVAGTTGAAGTGHGRRGAALGQR